MYIESPFVCRIKAEAGTNGTKFPFTGHITIADRKFYVCGRGYAFGTSRRIKLDDGREGFADEDVAIGSPFVAAFGLYEDEKMTRPVDTPSVTPPGTRISFSWADLDGDGGRPMAMSQAAGA